MAQLQENALFGEHDRYQLIRLLGRGGFSEVWLANDMQASDLNVALKVYAPGKGLDEDGVKQFRQEFSMVFNLNHPNLLRPTHFDVFEQMPYLILPYCKNGSGIKLVGKIDEQTAWKFLYEVASGLAYLHAQELIHQDIKPHNVLLDGNDTFLITDFGISAKARSTLRQSMQSADARVGTMTYMAPERFSENNLPVKLSDVWALGASLYELMTGDPPFGDQGGLLLQLGAKIPNIPGDWSAELKKIVQQCLQKEPWDRPTAQAISENAKRHVHKRTTTQSSRKKNSKFLMILSMAAILALGLCAGFVAGKYQVKTNPKLDECIQYIEQGDAIFDESDLTTWREALVKYQEAKKQIDQYDLQLPNMEHRIGQLQKKMDDIINISLENAKRAFSVRSEMAFIALKDVLEIDPDHEEAKSLYEQYSKVIPRKK